MAESEALVIHAQHVEDRRVEIADVDGILHDVVGEVIGRTVDLARP